MLRLIRDRISVPQIYTSTCVHIWTFVHSHIRIVINSDIGIVRRSNIRPITDTHITSIFVHRWYIVVVSISGCGPLDPGSNLGITNLYFILCAHLDICTFAYSHRHKLWHSHNATFTYSHNNRKTYYIRIRV